MKHASAFPSTPVGGPFSGGSFASLEKEKSGISPVRMNSLKAIAVPVVAQRNVEPFGPPQMVLAGAAGSDADSVLDNGNCSSHSGGLPVDGRCPPPSVGRRTKGAQGGAGPKQGATQPSTTVVAYLADDFDRRWVQSQSTFPHTRRANIGVGNGWVNIETFERLMTELEVLSYRNPNFSKLHVSASTLNAWSSDVTAPITATKDELLSFARKVEEYWYEKRAVFPKSIGTGLTHQLSRAAEESDGNGGLGSMIELESAPLDERVPLPFLRRTGDAELWTAKPGATAGPSARVPVSSGGTIPGEREIHAGLQAFVKTTVEAAEQLLERELLRLQHSEVTVAQLAALRREADGEGVDTAPTPDPSAPFPFDSVSSHAYQSWRAAQGDVTNKDS